MSLAGNVNTKLAQQIQQKNNKKQTNKQNKHCIKYTHLEIQNDHHELKCFEFDNDPAKKKFCFFLFKGFFF